MKILVTGNPRSGTLSMKNMLRSAGYDVDHERNGSQGTVSCFFFKKVAYYPREKMTQWRHLDETFRLTGYTHVYHLVRHPLDCVPSMVKIVGTGHQQWLSDIGIVSNDIKPKLAWSAYAWYRTNAYIERKITKAKVLRIEHIEKDWPRELNKPVEILHQHRGSGTRKSERTTWDALWKATKDDKLIDKMHAMTREYGYDV